MAIDMTDMERHRRGQEISWSLALGLGAVTAAAVTLFQLELLVAGFIAVGVLAVLGVGLLARRPRRFRHGFEMRTTSDADYPQSAYWLPFLPAGVVLLGSLGLEPAESDPAFAVPAYAAVMTASFTWAYRRSGAETRRVGRRRARVALEKADFSEATASRLDATESHREVVTALLSLGAVDGIQVRVWRLADELGCGVDALRERIRALSRHQVVRTSAVDAGDDPGRHLVELTPVGVRTVHELPHR